MHFLLRDAELPGGCLPQVGGKVFPAHLDGYGAEAQGAGRRPFQDFFLGVIMGIE